MAPVQLLYRVVHHPYCGCISPQEYQFDHVGGVCSYLWGREIHFHTIYKGATAYIFTTGNMNAIQHMLEDK